jgi:hypothetical protein
VLPGERHGHFAIIVGTVDTLVLFGGAFGRALKVAKIPGWLFIACFLCSSRILE